MKQYNFEYIGSNYIEKAKHNGYYVFWENNKRILVHRRIMEDHLGRKLEAFEVVHHVDGDKLNNDIKNLVVLSPEEHTSLHHAGKRKQ